MWFAAESGRCGDSRRCQGPSNTTVFAKSTLDELGRFPHFSLVFWRGDLQHAQMCLTAKREVVRLRRSCCATGLQSFLGQFPLVHLIVEMILILILAIEPDPARVTKTWILHSSLDCGDTNMGILETEFT
jgi:hypothetical protein